MNTIQLTSKFIQIVHTGEGSDVELISRVQSSGLIFKSRARNTFRASLKKLPEILKEMRGIESIDEVPEAFQRAYIDEIGRRIATQHLKQEGPSAEDTTLWKHQMLGVELARVNKRYNFFYDTRTGKTAMMLRIAYELLKEGALRRVLVICPAAIIPDWIRDSEAFFPELKYTTYHGTPKARADALKKPCHIVFWPTNMVANNIELLKKLKFDMVVFDESSKAKSAKTKTAEAVLDLSNYVDRWYNLSATPAPNGLHEYWIQMRCVDAYSFAPTEKEFTGRYFDDSSRDKHYKRLTIKPYMYSEFMSIVEDSSIFVEQNVMPTAGKEWHEVMFKLDPDEQDSYDTFKSEMIIDISEGVDISIEQAAAMRLKLQQLASGFIIDTEAVHENSIQRKLRTTDTILQEVYRTSRAGATSHSSRIRAVERLIGTFDDTASVIIWANFAEEFRMLNELLGDDAAYVRGGSSTTDKWNAINAFRAGKIRYLVAHPLSIGMGINLTVAHHIIYYSTNDSWEAFKQSSERTCGHIDVQPHVSKYYTLLAEGTTNVHAYRNVQNKKDASTGFLEHLRAEALDV